MRRAAAALVVVFALGSSLACTKKSADDMTSPTVTTSAASGTGTLEISSADVTCLNGDLLSDTEPTTVACDATHNQEKFSVPSSDLDDCYRAVQSSSDIQVVPDPNDPGSFDFDDDRVNGHAFSSSGAGPTECVVDLESTSDQVIGR